MKTLKLKLMEEIDDYEGCRFQELWSEDEKVHYSVSNLWECPEDATIDRDLVSAYEIVNFIEPGMKLAEKGYDRISVERIKVNPDENE